MISHKAIYALYPQVVSITERDDSVEIKDADGNDVTVDMDAVNAWTDPQQYRFDRDQLYPSIKDQLDMLWHAIDGDTLDKTSDFYTTLKQVKDDNPKPSE